MDYKSTKVNFDSLINIDDANQHLRVFDVYDNELIQRQIESATQWAEEFTHRKFLLTNVHGYQEKVSKDEIIYLPYGDITITEVKAAGKVITTGFKVNTFNNSIRFSAKLNDVEVKYSVGKNDHSEVEAPIKQAILLIVGNLYENREDTVVGVSASMIPFGSKNLLSTYRLYEG